MLDLERDNIGLAGALYLTTVSPLFHGSSWHQVDLQQWEQQLWFFGGAAGAADTRQPSDQASSPDS